LAVALFDPEFPGETGPLDSEDWAQAGDERLMTSATAKAHNFIRQFLNVYLFNGVRPKAFQRMQPKRLMIT
jgi:hypothetical protein